MTKNSMKLVGHLQVLDEPLSSLYSDQSTGQYFLFVRTYENTADTTYVLSEVKPLDVISYIDGKIGLTSIFTSNKCFYYIHREKLTTSRLKPINKEIAMKMLEDDGLEDRFDKTLSCSSMSIKKYLSEQ